MTTARERDLERALSQAKEALHEQGAILERLATASKLIATVVETNGEHMNVTANGALYQVNKQPKAKPGDLVTLISETMQVMDVIKTKYPTGNVCVVKNALKGRVEVDAGGGNGPRVVACEIEVNVGDRVVIDPSYSVVLDSLGPAPTKHKFVLDDRVTWDQIGGQEAAKQALKEAIEVPYKHKELFKKYGKKPVKGVLLSGPPGCGKTLLARAAATSLADTHGDSGTTGFIYVKGPELLSKWVGESEEMIRQLFETARMHYEQHGHPALLFIDEADALLGSRKGPEGSRGYLAATIVPQFLSEMDGLEESGAMVLLATNRPDVLDPAIVREGRVDRRVRVTRPTEADAEAIAKIHLKDTPTESPDAIAAAIAVQLFRPDREVAALDETPVGRVRLTVADLCSGAVVAGTVDQATTRALLRDVESKKKSPTGLTKDDVEWAVDQIHRSMRHINLQEAFEEKVEMIQGGR